MPTYSSFIFSDKEKQQIRNLHESFDICHGKLILKEEKSNEYNTLVAQVREVGLRAADLKDLKKEAQEKLSGDDKTKLVNLIDEKLSQTGL